MKTLRRKSEEEDVFDQKKIHNDVSMPFVSVSFTFFLAVPRT